MVGYVGQLLSMRTLTVRSMPPGASLFSMNCLNDVIISFDISISLNIPSSLLVKPAPHSTSTESVVMKFGCLYGESSCEEVKSKSLVADSEH